jgi:nucleoside-diphosphate-sugar epimerase
VGALRRCRSPHHRLADLESQIRWIDCHRDSVASFGADFRRFAPDTVFHLGWGGVDATGRDDVALQRQNFDFALDLVSLAADSGTEFWLGAGSQGEYGPLNRRIHEDDPTKPTTLYGAAKLSTYHMSSRLAALTGLGHAWLRIFSTYGPGDNPRFMLPSLICALQRGESPPLTRGEQLWDYLHVTDAAAAFITVARERAAGLFNLGSGTARPLREIISYIQGLINPAIPLQFGAVPYRPDQVMHLEADITRLQKATCWMPRVPLDEGLKTLIITSSSQPAR